MSKQYRILSASSAWELDKDVNHYLEMGYIPVGGVCAVTTSSGPWGGGSHDVEYHQAIYKPPTPSTSDVFKG